MSTLSTLYSLIKIMIHKTDDFSKSLIIRTTPCLPERNNVPCFILITILNLFEFVLDFTDINECNFDSLNNCSLTESTCEDNEGSFTCRCNRGYQQNGPFDCIGNTSCFILF